MRTPPGHDINARTKTVLYLHLSKNPAMHSLRRMTTTSKPFAYRVIF